MRRSDFVGSLLVPLLLATLAPVQAAAGPLELWLHLVPAARWDAGRVRFEDFLPQGRVALYRAEALRAGEATAELRAPLNTEVLVPEGRWTWVAEAPGWVGWEPGMQPELGTVVVSHELFAGRISIDQKLARRAVPACQVVLAGDWGGLARTQVASLTHRVRLPAEPAGRGRLAVPAGWWLPLAVDAGGRLRVGTPASCAAGDEVTAPPPRRTPAALPRLLLAALRGR
jgi:hypothetical protein